MHMAGHADGCAYAKERKRGKEKDIVYVGVLYTRVFVEVFL